MAITNTSQDQDKKIKLTVKLKFKEKNNFHTVYEIISLDEKSNTAFIKTKNSKEGIEKGNKWRIDDIIYFIGTGDYEIINERPIDEDKEEGNYAD